MVNQKVDALLLMWRAELEACIACVEAYKAENTHMMAAQGRVVYGETAFLKKEEEMRKIAEAIATIARSM